MSEHLQYWAGQLVLDGIYLVAMGILDQSRYCDISKIAELCEVAALATGVSPEQIREYDFKTGLDLNEV